MSDTNKIIAALKQENARLEHDLSVVRLQLEHIRYSILCPVSGYTKAEDLIPEINNLIARREMNLTIQSQAAKIDGCPCMACGHWNFMKMIPADFLDGLVIPGYHCSNCDERWFDQKQSDLIDRIRILQRDLEKARLK